MNWVLLRNSLLVSGGATLLAAASGLAMATWSAALPRRMRTVFVVLAIVALALPPFMIANCWLDLLGNTGIWHGWLPFDVLSLGGAIWLLALWLWPISFLAVSSAWSRLGPELLESDPAVTGLNLWRAVLLPAARTSLVQAGVITFVLALNNFTIPAILQVKALPAEVWVQFSTRFKAFEALKTAWPMLVGPLLLLVWLARQELVWPQLGRQIAPVLFRRQLGPGWVTGAGVAATVICVLSPGLPVLRLLGVERTWLELPGALAASHTGLWNSILYATATACVVTVVGLLNAARRSSESLLSAGRRLSTRSAFASGAGLLTAQYRLKAWTPYVMIWLPFLVPGVLLGIALIKLFNHPWSALLYEGPGIVILAFAIRYLAFGGSPLSHAVQSVDPDLVDAARLEGASGLQIFKHVLWPQIAPRVGAAWYIVFLLCLWDVESMILVVPPGGETLAFNVFNFLHYGHNAQVNALCLVLLGVGLLPLVAYGVWRALRGGRRPNSKYRNPKEVRSPKSEVRSSDCRENSQQAQNFAERISFCGSCAFLRRFRFSGFGFRICTGARVCATAPPAAASNSSQSSKIRQACTGEPLRLVLPDTVALRSSSVFGLRTSNFGLLLAAGLLLSSCTPGDNSKRLRSQFFSDVQIIASRGVGVGQVNKPRSVAIDDQDNLYAVDMTGRVQKFSSAGQFLLQWQLPQTDKGRPKGMCNDRQGHIVVNEPHYSRVNHFSPGGALVLQWGEHGTNAGQLAFPRAVAVNSRQEIFLSEYGLTERVQRFKLPDPAAAGAGAPQPPKFLNAFGRVGSGPGEFNRPEGLCVDAQDRLYVADSCNHRIQVFDSEGHFLRSFGRAGSGKGELSYPYDICVDHEGRQYVCEFGNSRIQVFDTNGRSLEIIGGPGAAPGQFANPWGVALDSEENLYVADSQNHRIQKLVRSPKRVAKEIRNPSTEGRKKSEVRSPKYEVSTGFAAGEHKGLKETVLASSGLGFRKSDCFRTSDFGLRTSLGFRPSDFGVHSS